MLAAIDFPSWLKPEIIEGLWLRWYGLMYIVAFAITYFLFKWQIKKRKLEYSDDDVVGFFFACIIGLVIGARLFGTLVYNFDRYAFKPWLIVLPFDENWNFRGWEGMSFHGGLVGLIAGALIYTKRHKLKFLEWADMVAVAAPLGYTFGRLGNFINGELWGKVSDAPWAMVFPHASLFNAAEDGAWVGEYASRAGIDMTAGFVNLPRHPSQLYEAMFEGVVLWLVLWFVVRNLKTFRGFATAAYVIGYGAIRFVLEYFREPDSNLGYIVRLGPGADNPHVFTSLFNISMGQILCLLMIIGGAIAMILFKKRDESEQIAKEEGTRQIDPRKARKKARNS
jgi:phosphatidylglycerol:prolipoprotein diacylglycerol transferase